MKFLRISRNIILALQFLTIATLIFGSTMLLLYSDTIRKYEWVGFTLLPENENILAESGEIDISFKLDPAIDTDIMVAETYIRMQGLPPNLKMTIWLFFTILGGIGYIMLMQLGRMIKSVEEGNPFNRWNVRRIYSLAILLAALPIIGRFFKALQKNWLLSNFEMEGVIIVNQPTDFLPWFLTAILVATIGKILEMGIEIKKEQDLTI